MNLGLGIILGGAALAVALAAVLRLFRRSEDLKLRLFRPYRGDPWPVGVQENDDFRFNWRPREETGIPVEVVIDTEPPAAPAPPVAARPHADAYEDIRGDPVAVERPGHVDVHRARQEEAR